MTWWSEAVVYQVYPRSFADGNGDGTGDLAGITARLDHLVDLGVDALWLSPFYPSPLRDSGYDVSDYCDVDPRFGTLADFDELVAAASARGLRVIVDIVPNHCSSDHALFQAAVAAGPGSAERALFHFRNGRGADGDEPPNNWHSAFGGPAWTRLSDGEWYLHLFDSSQPDWNWDNPAVPALFEDVLRFWLDRGVAGFRVDVGGFLFKDPSLPDDTPGDPASANARSHRAELHELYRRWRAILDSYSSDAFPGERIAISENWATPAQLSTYFAYAGLPQAMNFSLILSPWDAAAIRTAVDDMLAVAGPEPARLPWVIGNHDVTRPVTRLGAAKHTRNFEPDVAVDLALGRRRARALALFELALPGSAYVYQGEELGLPEVDVADAERDDPVFFRTKGRAVGRDGCRVPIPWSGDVAPFGFSPAGVPTWLSQPADWAALTVDAQSADPTSMLSLYRDAIASRPTGAFAWLPSGDNVLMFTRGQSFVCVVNLGATPTSLPAGDVILASIDDAIAGGALAPDAAAWIRPAG